MHACRSVQGGPGGARGWGRPCRPQPPPARPPPATSRPPTPFLRPPSASPQPPAHPLPRLRTSTSFVPTTGRNTAARGRTEGLQHRQQLPRGRLVVHSLRGRLVVHSIHLAPAARRCRRAQALTWDADTVTRLQPHANKCVFVHSSGEPEAPPCCPRRSLPARHLACGHSCRCAFLKPCCLLPHALAYAGLWPPNNYGAGENIHQPSVTSLGGQDSCAWANAGFYSEITNYNWVTASGKINPTDGSVFVVGHFKNSEQARGSGPAGVLAQACLLRTRALSRVARGVILGKGYNSSRGKKAKGER